MTIYLDEAKWKKSVSGRTKYSHMVSDVSLQELHTFAASIGVKRHFFHNANIKHYDINDARSLEFFKVHSKVDIEHQKTWKKILAKHAKTKQQQRSVRTALRKSLKAMERQGFSRIICRYFNSPSSI